VIPSAFATLLVIGVLQPLSSQTPSRPETSPSVSLSLPRNMPSETVQIIYFMVGPFGGYGGNTGQRSGLHSYEIAASVEGKAATEIRMIVYAPGCEIQTFVVPLVDDSRVNRKFECQPVRSVLLSGQIVPNELIQDKHAELIVTYMAFWSHQFFGIADGAVAEFRLATASPDMNGMFQVDLPLFSADDLASSSQSRASLRLTLRDSKTLNHIASNLEPELLEHRSEDHGLRIQSYYPNGLKFMAEP
jgi:hypothetical protein